MKVANQSVVINSVDRAMDIIEYLFSANKAVSLTQISRDLELYKSTVYRTLATLQNRGFVQQDPNTGNYSLGIKVFVIGSQIKPDFDINSVIRTYMERLQNAFHETVTLSVLSRDAVGRYKSVAIAHIPGTNKLSSSIDIGALNECYCSAVGKCLLAFSEHVDLSIYETYPMVHHTRKTITSLPALKKALAHVRQEKYALDDEEWENGLFCIAAPLLSNGSAVAAISVSGPTSRLCDGNLTNRINYIRDICAEISAHLAI